MNNKYGLTVTRNGVGEYTLKTETEIGAKLLCTDLGRGYSISFCVEEGITNNVKVFWVKRNLKKLEDE